MVQRFSADWGARSAGTRILSLRAFFVAGGFALVCGAPSRNGHGGGRRGGTEGSARGSAMALSIA
eukprot:439580-Pyramimonas_sp.AAC.1